MIVQNMTQKLSGIRTEAGKISREVAIKQLAMYDAFMDHYGEVPDESMPYVFAEFQRGLRQRAIHAPRTPCETPAQMREYLSKAHVTLGDRL